MFKSSTRNNLHKPHLPTYKLWTWSKCMYIHNDCISFQEVISERKHGLIFMISYDWSRNNLRSYIRVSLMSLKQTFQWRKYVTVSYEILRLTLFKSWMRKIQAFYETKYYDILGLSLFKFSKVQQIEWNFLLIPKEKLNLNLNEMILWN